MKKFFLLLMLMFLIVSCGNEAESTVNKFMGSIKAKKINDAKKYVSNEGFTENVDTKYQNKTEEVMFESLFKNMNYKIIKSTKDKESNITLVETEIENVDFKEVFQLLFEEAVNDLSNGQMTFDDEYFENKLLKILERNDLPKRKDITVFKVIKTDKGNKIELTPENMDIVMGQIYTSIEGISDPTSSETSGKSVQQPAEQEASPGVQPSPQPMQKK